MPHQELLFKLRSIGIAGSLWKWFENYLTSHHQYVAVNEKRCKLLLVLSGIPQGSILGPLFFAIYVNDLPSVVSHSIPFLFADDTKCVKSIVSDNDRCQFQEDLSNLNSWSQRWHLHFNSSKFRLIKFHLNTVSSSNTHSYIINGQTIESSTSHKYLGILLTDTLNWEEHYHCISLRAYRQLGLLWRTFCCTQVSAKKELYLSLVRSQLLYCSLIWRPNQIQHILLLEKVQHHATKFILSNSSLDYKARVVSLHLLPLMFWLELADITLLDKHIKYPDNRLRVLYHITFSTSRTRSSTYCKLSYKRSRTIKSRHFYFNRVCRLWNGRFLLLT